jgi:hypothetical protein
MTMAQVVPFPRRSRCSLRPPLALKEISFSLDEGYAEKLAEQAGYAVRSPQEQAKQLVQHCIDLSVQRLRGVK